MKLNNPFKFALCISVIIVFFILLFVKFAENNNAIIVGSILSITFFFSIFYLLKFQFYEKIKIIYKNIYKYKGTSNVADLNLDNANI